MHEQLEITRSRRHIKVQTRAAGRQMMISTNADVPALFQQALAVNTSAARAFLFMILTAARPIEVYSMRWCEVDFDDCLWVVPAKHTKSNQAYHIPLSRQALALLGDKPRSLIDDHVFLSDKAEPLGSRTFSELMRWQSMEGVPYDFRSAFKEWAVTTEGHPMDVVAMFLGHTVKPVFQYALPPRDMQKEHATIMQRWADYAAAVPIED